jgi:heterodisulfide reductase subunit A-like polyferredoxin
MIPVIDQDLCTGCKKCMEVCPPRAIEVHGNKARIDAEYCEECGYCAPVCPVKALIVPFPRCES